MEQINDLRASRQQAERQRDELMQRAQYLHSKSQENVITGM